MKKKYTLIGACVGGAIGIFINAFIILAIVGAVIGFVIGRNIDAKVAEEEAKEFARRKMEAERIAERQKQEHLRQVKEFQKKSYIDEVCTFLSSIENKVVPGFTPTEEYKGLSVLEQKAQENGWSDDFKICVGGHCAKLRKIVAASMCDSPGLPGLCEVLSAASCLKCAEPTNENNPRIADNLFQTVQTAFSTGCYLEYGDYGQCTFLLENPDEMNRVSEIAEALMPKLENQENFLISTKGRTLFDNIDKNLNPQSIKDACMLMWYYAQKWPFDVNAFEKARKLYLKHTSYFLSDPKQEDALVEIGPVEEVLARVYAKNRIGGIGTAKQEKPYIDLWLDKRIEMGDWDPCYALAHGLAWMELYELEIDILRRLIQAGADVPAELQDRLTFLENGGTEDVKIYDIEPFDNIYFFDSSVPEWSVKDISTFFRKVAMKKMRFQYSLALTKWTKTLPLTSGQKFLRTQLHNAFKELAQDFDGEVNCEMRNAAAINLSNVVFPNATLFTFNSLRNRCIDILFYCEKFGRNLNITIFTLFTPGAELDFEELERYCLAIKDNMYVESFRESILQIVDEAIKVKQTVYEDEDAPRKKMVFDE